MQATESPGGLGADATNPDFPEGTASNLCDGGVNATCLAEHEYEFDASSEFDDLPKATTFAYDTKSNTDAEDTNIKELLEDDKKFSPLPADESKYDKLSP